MNIKELTQLELAGETEVLGDAWPGATWSTGIVT
jgi:hypothetical protein